MHRKFDPKVFQLGFVRAADRRLRQDEGPLRRNHRNDANREGRRRDGVSIPRLQQSRHRAEAADGKALLHLGYQLKPEIELKEFAADVEKLGLVAKIKSDSQPGIARLVEVEGPGGNVFQFYSQMMAPAPGFAKSGVLPLRLGHVAVISQDAEKLMKFYEDFLGFWLTDDIGKIANFYTCNREHHVVNIVNAPLSKVHHVAFQLKGNAHHAVAGDILRESGVSTLWGPSRHTAGHNIAAYHHDPDKLMIELYTDMDVFIPELGLCEPRPWHEHAPMLPRSWQITELAAWNTGFEYNLAQG